MQKRLSHIAVFLLAKTKTTYEKMTKQIMNTYGRQNVAFTRGEGVYLWDTDGKKYLDALGGIAVCALGHAHPTVTKAISEQAARLIHTSNIYRIPAQEALADKLCEVSDMENVFFGNSGAEANEAAIKLARLFGHNKNIQMPEIIVTDNSFHGRTLATLSATGNRKIHAGFEPLVHGFIRVPYNDLDAIQQVASNSKNVVAILVEPIQGEGGINIPDSDYLNGIRNLCDENDWLMMLDEIQTGMCRTAKWFAHQHNNIKPDVMTLAKSLGNGVPIGACLASGKAASLFQPGNHGSTYGGNPLACHVALNVINALQDMNANEKAKNMGNYLLTEFQKQLSDNDGVIDIRGSGLMMAIQLDRPCAELVALGIEHGLLINVTANNVVRLLPPLIISQSEADELVEKLVHLISQFLLS